MIDNNGTSQAVASSGTIQNELMFWHRTGNTSGHYIKMVASEV